MTSLANIPEPTSAYRPDQDEPTAHAVPLAVSTPQGITANAQTHNGDEDAPEQQVDSVSWLLLLLIAGGLLRGVLGLFGPLQGIDPFVIQQLDQDAQQLVAGDLSDPYPLTALLWAGVSAVGVSGWVLVLIGSLLSLASVPAAFIIGRQLTGRCAPGIIAAGIVAVHPAVLTAANSPTGASLAIGFVTLGLALCLLASKRGKGIAIAGGVLLGCAAIASPLCWIAGLLVVPMVFRNALTDGKAKAFVLATVVLLIALGPALALRGINTAQHGTALLPEFSSVGADKAPKSPTDRLLITLTDPSLAELGRALHLPLNDAGRLTAYQPGAVGASEQRDVVADVLADAWLLVNTALAGFAAVSIGVMLLRRRWLETLLLAGPLVALAWCTATPGEALRLPMLALMGVLAAGLLAKQAVVVVDEQALAERKARKLAKQEARERLKQEKHLSKHKDSLYAFDKPSRSERKQRQQAESQPIDEPTVAGVLTQSHAENTDLPARPI